MPKAVDVRALRRAELSLIAGHLTSDLRVQHLPADPDAKRTRSWGNSCRTVCGRYGRWVKGETRLRTHSAAFAPVCLQCVKEADDAE